MIDKLYHLNNLFYSLGVELPANAKAAVLHDLDCNSYPNKHYSFIIDLKTNKLLCYEFNIYFNTDSFPFSVHAEIQSIVRYYKSKTISKNKKLLVVVKMSRSGLIGNSKCCLNCMRFIRNNWDNLNLKKVYYSTDENVLVSLNKDELVDENFRPSKGYNYRSRALLGNTTK